MSCSAADLTELAYFSSLLSTFKCYVTVDTRQRKAGVAGDAVLLSGPRASSLQQENMFAHPVTPRLSRTPAATCLSFELRLWIRKWEKLQREASSSGGAMQAAAQHGLNMERTVWPFDPAAEPLCPPLTPAKRPPGQGGQGGM